MTEGRLAALRLILGTLQVLGVSASLVLLLLPGVNVWSLAPVVVTCLFTTVSVLLFGSRGKHLAACDSRSRCGRRPWNLSIRSAMKPTPFTPI